MQQQRTQKVNENALENSRLYLQPGYSFAMHKMLLDDLVDICAIAVGIPDRLRVDHAYRPLRTSIQATGTVDPHTPLPGYAQFLDLLLGVVTQRHGIVVHAALPARLTLIGAEKDVALVIVLLPQKPYSRDIAVKVSLFSLPAGTSELFLMV